MKYKSSLAICLPCLMVYPALSFELTRIYISELHFLSLSFAKEFLKRVLLETEQRIDVKVFFNPYMACCHMDAFLSFLYLEVLLFELPRRVLQEHDSLQKTHTCFASGNLASRSI